MQKMKKNEVVEMENQYRVIEPHESKYCTMHYSAAMNNECGNWITRQFEAGEQVGSLLIENNETIVVIDNKGKAWKIPLRKVELISENPFGIPMEETTTKPIKTGIKLTYPEIFLIIFLGLALIGFGIVKFKGVSTKKIAPSLAN